MCSHLFKNKRSGFTLIELLVVISIIGLLSSLVLAAVSDAKIKSQSAKAALDIHTLDNALELYYQDHGSYPAGPDTSLRVDTTSTGNWNTLGTYLQKYLPTMPTPNFDSFYKGTILWQGYIYSHATQANPYKIRVFDGAHGSAFVACLIIYDGFWIDMLTPQQNNLSNKDTGIDPDGVDILRGNYKITNVPSDCT